MKGKWQREEECFKKKYIKRIKRKKGIWQTRGCELKSNFFLFNFLISSRLSFFQLNHAPLFPFLPLFYNDENAKN